MKLESMEFSEKASDIVSKKNKYWEHLLCVQLLDEELLLVNSALQDLNLLVRNSFLRFSNLVRNNCLDEMFDLLSQNMSYHKTNQLNFNLKYNTKNNANAFGPLGKAGDPLGIKAYCQRYASEYYECRYRHIELKSMFYAIDDFLINLNHDKEGKYLIKDFGENCLEIIRLYESQIIFMEGFGSHIRNAIEAAKKGRAAYVYEWKAIDASSAVMRENLRCEFKNLQVKNVNADNCSDVSKCQHVDEIAAFAGDPSAQTVKEVLAWLSTQGSVSLVALRQKLLPLGLMPSALINDVNERAFEIASEPALEESDNNVTVHRGVLLQVLADW